MTNKQFTITLTALLAAGKRLTEENSVAALANWCDKVSEFETLSLAASKAARALRTDDSVSLAKKMSVAQLTVKLPTKLKPRKIFRSAFEIAKAQAKRVKTIAKSKAELTKHLTK